MYILIMTIGFHEFKEVKIHVSDEIYHLPKPLTCTTLGTRTSPSRLVEMDRYVG